MDANWTTVVRSLRLHPSDPKLTVLDDELLAEAARRIEIKRQRFNEFDRHVLSIYAAERREYMKSITPVKYILDWRRNARAEYANQLRNRRNDRQKFFLTFIHARGCRYASCRLRNFRADLPEQKSALKAILAYDHDMLDRLD